MRKSCLILSLLLSSAASLQAVAESLNIEVTQPRRIAGQTIGSHPVLSPDGALLLFSTPDQTGLSALDMATGAISPIDPSAGAGFAPVFSADSKEVVYQRVTANAEGLQVRDLCRRNLLSGATVELTEPGRETPAPAAANPGSSYAVAMDGYLEVCIDGNARQIRPLDGDHKYLWASLSPDGSQLMFTEPFDGVYTCASDGSSPRKIAARGDYPCWIGDGLVAMIVSHDDGYTVLSADLVVVDPTTTQSMILSPENVIIAELTAAPATSTLVYSTAEGKLFKLKVKRQ